MPAEHLMFAEQTANWTTWTAPDKAIPVTNFAPTLGLGYVDHRATGSGRALVRSWMATKEVSGSLSMAGWEKYLGYFVKQALMHDTAVSTPVGATTAKQHGFLPKDDTMPKGLSVQALRNSNAQSFKGVLFNRLTFNCQAGEALTLDMDWIARDEASAGGTWLDDGAAAPSALTPAYFPTSVPAFMFHSAQLFVGGTTTLDAGKKIYTITGGTEYVGIDMAEVVIENNLDAKILWGLKVPRNVIGGDRAATGRFDMDQSTLNAAFTDMARNGTRAALRLLFTGTIIEAAIKAELEIVLPNVVFPEADLPALQGGNERRMQSVSFTGLADSNGYDIAVRIVDTTASY